MSLFKGWLFCFHASEDQCKDTCLFSMCLSLDPLDWSCVHVQKWLLWTEHLYRLPQVSTMFQELTGRDLCSMTEVDFRQRSSQFGDVLYAHLDIWRSGKNRETRKSIYSHSAVSKLRKRWLWSKWGITSSKIKTASSVMLTVSLLLCLLAAAMKERCPPVDSKSCKLLVEAGFQSSWSSEYSCNRLIKIPTFK